MNKRFNNEEPSWVTTNSATVAGRLVEGSWALKGVLEQWSKVCGSHSVKKGRKIQEMGCLGRNQKNHHIPSLLETGSWGRDWSKGTLQSLPLDRGKVTLWHKLHDILLSSEELYWVIRLFFFTHQLNPGPLHWPIQLPNHTQAPLPACLLHSPVTSWVKVGLE